jgi:outer membrane protein TolC
MNRLAALWLGGCVISFVRLGCAQIITVTERPVGLLDALRATLEKHPNIQIQQRQIEYNRGALQVAAGQFDRVYSAGTSQSYTSTPLTTAQAQNTDATNYSAGAQQQFRNGITVSPSIQTNRSRDNVVSPHGADSANLSFQVIVPLLKGRGRDVVTAQERAGRSALDASLFDLNNTVAQLLAGTAVQYWQAAAAARDVEIAKESEERGRKYAQDVRVLIDADRVAAQEINNLEANIADRAAGRIAAEQRLLQARQNLALAMGLGADEIGEFPLTTEPLPNWQGGEPPAISPALLKDFTARALTLRADLMASRERRHGAEALLPAARNQLKPQLDLTMSAGYAGLMEGKNYFRMFGAPFTNVPGPTAVASLRYSFAPKNNGARGALAEAQSSLSQTQLQSADLARNIVSAAATAMIAVAESVAQLRREEDAVRSYRLALTGEQQKFRLGLVSLVDVLTVEDRLTAALSSENAARLQYATALENLRYATGTVVDPKTEIHALDRSTFVTPPFEWGAK